MEPEVPQDSYNLDAEWGPGGCDIRHRFVTSLIYQLPLSSSGASGRWGTGARRRNGSSATGRSPSFTRCRAASRSRSACSATPPTRARCSNVNPVRANVVPGVSPDLPDDERTTDKWFNTAAFTTPAAYTFGDAGRNSVYGPGLQKTDIALQRDFPIAGADAPPVPRRGVQRVQPHESRHAGALRQHAAVRQRDDGRDPGAPDPVRRSPAVLGRSSQDRRSVKTGKGIPQLGDARVESPLYAERAGCCSGEEP